MEIILLSEKFYSKYGNCKEVLNKPSRPYIFLKLRIGSTAYAIPFRHHIEHNYAFLTYDDCGIDYTKAVVIPDETYIKRTNPQVEQKEYNIIKKSENKIIVGFTKYLTLYKKARMYRSSPHYSRINEYTSLQYFDDLIL